MPNVSAIVLAAGAASRMGGPNKVLLPWAGSTMVGTVVDTLKGCSLNVIVVTGRDAEMVAKSVCCPCVFNPAFYKGIGNSIACGVAAMPDADAYLIALADMPELRSEVVRALIAKVSPENIVAPVYELEGGRPGHPVIFGRAFRADLLNLDGDNGAKSIIARNREKLTLISAPGEFRDFDTAEQWSQAARP